MTTLDPQEICSLPPTELSERLEWIRAEILPHAIRRVAAGDGAVAWELEGVPGLAQKLEQLVVLERECCSGIDFSHRESETAGRLYIEVRGVDPSASIFAEVGASAHEPATGGLGGRIAKAGGIGAAVGLLVCCIAPIGMGALFGAAAAAPFATLDQPWIIALAAVVFGAAAFAWQERRRARATAAAAGCESGC